MKHEQHGTNMKCQKLYEARDSGTNIVFHGDAYFSIALNGSIHFVMYGYYLVTAFNVTVPMFSEATIDFHPHNLKYL